METFFSALVLFMLVVVPLIIVHEWGHYIVARLCGIAVKSFSIGFGPELFGWTGKQGTRFKFSPILLGGYVEFMERGEFELKLMAQEARDTLARMATGTQSETPEHTAGRTDFESSNVWARIATTAAGPLVNIACAFILFSIFFYAYGKTDYAVASAMVRGFHEVVNTTTLTFGAIGDILSGKKSFFGMFAGPVGIAQVVGQVTSLHGLGGFLFIMAHISLALGIMNILPIPALDGGHLVFYAAEVASGRPIKKKWLGAANAVGFALLLALFVAVTYGDIARIFSS